MNALIILTAIIAGGFLGMVAGVGLCLNREKIGDCEECGKGCRYIFYCGDDCELKIGDVDIDIDDIDEEDSSIPDKHEGSE